MSNEHINRERSAGNPSGSLSCSAADIWREVECTNPSCRGKRSGGNGFIVRVTEETYQKFITGNLNVVECNECFSR